MSKSDRLLTISDIMHLRNVSKTTAEEYAKCNGFPRVIYLAPNIRRWRASEVYEFFDNLDSKKS